MLEPLEQEGPIGLFAGLCTVDLEYIVDEFPAANMKISAGRQELTAGGPATNAAATFSFLGGAARLITAVGCHPVTGIIRRDLAACQVCLIDAAPQHEGSPAVSSIFVHARTGERTVVSANAAAYRSVSFGITEEDMARVRLLLVDGHHTGIATPAARLARRLGIPVVLDGGSWKVDLPLLLPFVDIAVCSEDFRSPSGSTEESVVRTLFDFGVSQVAITRGAKPIRWFVAGTSGEIAVNAVKAKDTLGAGDVFHGAFCYAHCRGASLKEALEFGSNAAAEKCLYFGTRSWMTSETLDKLRPLTRSTMLSS